MKRSYLLIVLVFIVAYHAGGAHGIKNFEYTDSISVPGISKEILFNRASLWVHETFRAQYMSIKVQDKASGVIFGDISITDKNTGRLVSFSLAMKISDGQCLYVFDNYTNAAGDLSNAKPACCMTGRKWRATKNWANAATRRLETGLKEKISARSASEDFLTVPLIDSTMPVRQEYMQPAKNKSRPVSFYVEGGGAYAPGIFSHSGSTTGQVTAGEPITMYHFSGGIFVPSRKSLFKGVSIEAGYFSFPFRVKTTYPLTGTAPLIETTTKTARGLDFFPHYTWLSRKKRVYQLRNSIGIDLMYPSATAVADLIGLKAESGIGFNGFYLSASADYTVNNVYGNRRGQAATTIKPLFFGLNLSFYAQENKWIKNIFGK